MRIVLLFSVWLCLDLHAQKAFSPDKYGYISDTAFHQLIKDRGYDFIFPFRECITCITEMKYAVVHKNGKKGLIDTTGREVVPPEFRRVSGDPAINSQVETKKELSPRAEGRNWYQVLRKRNILLLEDNKGFIMAGNKLFLYDSSGKKRKKLDYEVVRKSGNRATEFMSVRREGRYGVIHSSGKEILPPVYKSVYVYGRYAGDYIIWFGQKVALFDASGVMLVDSVYDRLDISHWSMKDQHDSSHSTFLTVRLKGKWGLIDRHNTVKIPIKYDSIRYLGHHYYAVHEGKTQGIMRSDGSVILPVKYDSVGYFRQEGIFVVGLYQRIAGKGKTMLFGVADDSGRVMGNIKYHQVYFKEFQKVSLGMVRIGTSYGLIDLYGREMTSISYQYPVFSRTGNEWSYFLKSVNNMARDSPRIYTRLTVSPTRFIYEHNGRWGMKHHSGRQVLLPVYDSIAMLPGNVYWVKQRGCHGLTDSGGNVLLPPVYDKVYGDSAFYVLQNKRIGYARNNGQIVFPPKYKYLHIVHEGGGICPNELAVAGNDGLHGLIESGGRILVPFRYRDAMKRGFMLSGQVEPDTLKGEKPLKYSDIRWFRNGYAVALADSVTCIVDCAMKAICPTGYHDIYHHHMNYFRTSKFGKFGILDSMMREIVPPVYYHLEGISGYDCIVFTLNAKKGIIDLKGNVLIPAIFDAICAEKENGMFGARMGEKKYRLDRYGHWMVYEGYMSCY